MYFDDHSPAHFHAFYGEHIARIEIDTLRVISGTLPRRAMAMVLEWATEHRDDLMENWKLAQGHLPIKRIPGLE